MQSGPAAASTTTNIRILVVEEFGFSQLTNIRTVNRLIV